MSYSYQNVSLELLECARFLLSEIKPHVWAEQNRMMTTDISPIPGMLSYKNSPYTREIVDCLAPDHPARIIAVMKGAQIGFSTTVIEAAIGWIISQNPGNILFLVGHETLVEEAMTKVDRMIDSCGLRHLIKPNIQRAKNMKTGDTNTRKDFPGGSLVVGTANHKLLRNRSIQYGFMDDFEAMKGDTKQSGDTTEMIEQRFAAYAKKMKLFYISTPEVKQSSNIEPVYLLGDQRKYNIHCPCCKNPIDLRWSIQVDGNEKNLAGITWKVNQHGHLSDVGYICQLCAGFFDDSNKNALVQDGFWKPTAEPSQMGYYSYHISSLYAPSYMFDWEHYVIKFIKANPIGQPRDEKLHQTFVNLTLGETYAQQARELSGSNLQMNTRPYMPGTVPEQLSIKDGNGKIVLLTIGCDMNGKEDDARLDYEIVAWSETGSTYSVLHGSIGTFVSRESNMTQKIDRYRWTYLMNRERSVWKELDKILAGEYKTESGRPVKILIGGLDCGYLDKYAYPYLDDTKFFIIGLKGKGIDKLTQFGHDVATFKPSKERPKSLYLVEVNMLKDDLADIMGLKWQDRNEEAQPVGFMNFPMPQGNAYQYENFFSHFEAEHKIEKIKNGQNVFLWEKKTSTVQNHSFDTRIYNMVLRDILIKLVSEEQKDKYFSWRDYVAMIAPRIK